MDIHEIKLAKITSTGYEISNRYDQICAFCEKIVAIDQSNLKSCLEISGNNFYCPFCLRNNFHARSSSNILIMSFRAIIGYYYHRLYNITPRRIYFTEIQDLIQKQIEIGLSNPVFCYDPETYLWFIDFNRIGQTKNKTSFNHVLDDCVHLVEAMNIIKIISPTANAQTCSKYSTAIKLFHEKRKRPTNKRMLIPTFNGVSSSNTMLRNESDKFWKTTKYFSPNDLFVK